LSIASAGNSLVTAYSAALPSTLEDFLNTFMFYIADVIEAVAFK